MAKKRVHQLKCWPPYFDHVCTGIKPFEVRPNDRDFAVGDELSLREWEPVAEEYTGRAFRCTVAYVLHGPDFGIEQGYVVMGLSTFDPTEYGPLLPPSELREVPLLPALLCECSNRPAPLSAFRGRS